MSYPASLDTFSHKDEGPGNYLFAKDVNDITTAIHAVQGVLGLEPAGSSASVSQRLLVIQNDQTDLSATVDSLSGSVDALLVMGGGPTGPTGPTGPAGPPGQPRFVGSGSPPQDVVGAVPGDRYLDESTGQIYTLT